MNDKTKTPPSSTSNKNPSSKKTTQNSRKDQALSSSSAEEEDYTSCSIMQRKFAMGGEVSEFIPFEPTYPQLFFFYDSLMNEKELLKVLQLQKLEGLIHQNVTLVGYEMKMWGSKRALVAKNMNVVRGAAYAVGSKEEVERLQAHFCSNYRNKFCDLVIEVEGKKKEEVVGKVFVWHADKGVLK